MLLVGAINQVEYVTLQYHGCHDLSSITTSSPSGLGVVINDKSWQPWYNYYLASIPYPKYDGKWVDGGRGLVGVGVHGWRQGMCGVWVQSVHSVSCL